MNTVKQNNMDIELITKLLFEKYGFSLNLAELSDVIKISHQTIVGTHPIWPPRAFTFGQLTHNDLASVRIPKRATKSL